MRTLHRLAAAATVAAVAATLIGSEVLDRRMAAAGHGDLTVSGLVDWPFTVAVAASAAVGATLLVRRPGHPVGWCFAGLALSVAIVGALYSYGLWGLFVRPGSVPYPAAAAKIQDALFVVWLAFIGLVCYLTPTGRHLSPAFRRCGWALVAFAGAWLALRLVSPKPMEPPFAAVANPWSVPMPIRTFAPISYAAAIGTNLFLLVGMVSLIVRYVRADTDERRRLLWIAVAALPLPVLVALTFVLSGTDRDLLLSVTAAVEVAVLPVGAALAITRYHLYDVERILSRAAAYLLVSAVLAATYATVVLAVARGAGQASGRSEVGIALATLAVATAARPVYRMVQDLVDRRFSRRRYDAVHTVRRYVATPTPDVTVEEVLRRAVGDPSLTVAYWVPTARRWVTGEGRPASPPPGSMPVDRAGRRVAALSFDPDRVGAEVVRAAVREAGAELDNAGLRAAVALQLEEVRASRTRIATAQFEERRRIERALHDGAQQRLLALAASQQAALLSGDAEQLRTALRAGVAESRAAVRELRELANGLHPSVLTDGGLTAALDDLASRLPVQVDHHEPGRRFPPAVEAAAWFAACEAVANAVKHAGAGRIRVTVDPVDAQLALRVEDDGRGGADPDGQGLRGIADRVAAAHGRLTVDSEPGRGTVVTVVLPCA